MSPVYDTIKLRGGSAAEWASINPILAVREIGVETDTKKMKIGDGATHWTGLPYMAGSATQSASDVGADPAGAAERAQAAAATDATTKVAAETARASTAEAAAVISALAGAATDATSKVAAEATRAIAAEGAALLKSNNLSDLGSATTARSNLGLGSAATQASSAFDASGAAAAAQSAAISAAATDATSKVATETTRALAGEAAAAAAPGPPSGSAGGGLSGTYPSPTVTVVAAGSAGPLSAQDASTTNSRTPTGAAGGGLGGTYPSPTVTVVAPGGTGPLNAADTTLVVVDANGHFPATSMPLTARREALNRRTLAIAESFPRQIAANSSALVFGQMQFVAIPLLKGQIVSKIGFVSGTTAISGQTNQWFALWNSAVGLIGTTTDDTTTSWPANTEKALSMQANYTVLADALFYVSVLVAGATTPNSVLAIASNAAITGLAPALQGRDTTHTLLTNPASAPSTATLAVSSIAPYAWVG